MSEMRDRRRIELDRQAYEAIRAVEQERRVALLRNPPRARPVARAFQGVGRPPMQYRLVVNLAADSTSGVPCEPQLYREATPNPITVGRWLEGEAGYWANTLGGAIEALEDEWGYLVIGRFARYHISVIEEPRADCAGETPDGQDSD